MRKQSKFLITVLRLLSTKQLKKHGLAVTDVNNGTIK